MNSNILKRINIFDNYILLGIKKHIQNKYLDRLMPLITYMGNLGIIWIAIALILILNKPYRPIGNIVIITLIIGTIVGEGIVKHIVKRIRPCNIHNDLNLLITKPISYSFPSGHTLSSFAAAEILSKYFGQYKLIFIALALLIAISRLYLYVHYPTDVIAGMILGILCSKLVFIFLQGSYMERITVLYKRS